MGFNVHHWSRSFTVVTVMASIYPSILAVSHALAPSLARSTAFSFSLWTLTFMIYYLITVDIFRKWKKKYGSLKSDAPRSRLTGKEKMRWQIRSTISLTSRAAAVFLSSSDRGQKPWLRASLKSMPGPWYFLHVMIFIVCLDGIFYTAHRLQHTNRFLYKHVHSMHHEMHLPTAISALHDSVFEKFFNAFIQIYLTSFIVPMDFWSLHFTCYAIFFGEIGGHTGIRAAMSPPYTPLLDFLDVAITIESHDLHHRLVKRNYGKQTVIFDKLFGTYQESIETVNDITPLFPKVSRRPSTNEDVIVTPCTSMRPSLSASDSVSSSSSDEGDPILLE